MALTPADTLSALASPTATNSGLPSAEFPGVRRIQRTDLVGPVATIKPHASTEKCSLTLREKINNLIEVVNQLDSWYVRMTAAVQKNGKAGYQGDLSMNGFLITGLPTDPIGASGNDDWAVSRAQVRAFSTSVATITPGTIWTHAGNVVPTGWLACNGADYDPTDSHYTALYNYIGYTWGSVGGRFKVPNFSRRFPVGAMGGYAVGTLGGEEAHVLSWDEMPVHSHPFNHPFNVPNGLGAAIVASASNRQVPVANGTTGSAGSGWGHENRPPFAALNFLIKL
jgi:microcystin-dependent protein